MTLALGAWARAEGLTGIVTRTSDDEVTVFSPADRRMVTVEPAAAQPVPASAVHVRLDVELPLPHGVEEEWLRRWIATLVDPVLRERAAAALSEAGQDDAPARPTVTLSVGPADLPADATLCLCGTHTPHGAAVCETCGRAATGPPAPRDDR